MAALIHKRVQEKAELKAKAEALLAIAERSEQQEADLVALEAKIKSVNSDIERLAALQDEERKQGNPEFAHVEVGTDRATLEPWGPSVSADASDLQKEEAQHIALGRFALAVRAYALGKGSDVRLMAAATGMGTQSDSSMGFAVPKDVAPGIERDMFEGGELLGRVDARPITNGNSIAYNVMDQTSRADGSRQGGVLGYWVDEGTAPTATSMKLSRMELKLRKVGCLGVMTDELLEDAAALGGELQNAFREELIFQVENKIYRGNGSAAPLGFLNAPSLVSVSKETGQAAATIVGENITKMWARMPVRSHSKAVWLANVDCIPQLSQLVQNVGTAGYAYPYASVNNGSISLWGRPVVFVEYAESVGTVGDLALVDLSKYRLIRKGGIEQASSMHVYFAQGEQAFRAFYRVDGQPVPRAALTPFKGSNTLSPFVVLATRS
jgi:HK97 family phage major capsid protein